MKFTREHPAEINLIRSYVPHEVRIGERIVGTSALITPTELIAGWPPQRVSELTAGNLEQCFAWRPEIFLLGTGAKQCFPTPEIYAAVQSRGIGFEVMDTGAACRTYNVLATEGRRVALGLLIEQGQSKTVSNETT